MIRKYNFKIRLTETHTDKPTVYMEMNEVSLTQIVNLLNESLATSAKVVNPNYIEFKPTRKRKTKE